MKTSRRSSLKLITSAILASPFAALSRDNCEIPDDYVFAKLSIDGHTFYFNYFDEIIYNAKKESLSTLFRKADYVFQSIQYDANHTFKTCLKARWSDISEKELDGRSLAQAVHGGGCSSYSGFSGDVKIQQKRIIKEYGRGNL